MRVGSSGAGGVRVQLARDSIAGEIAALVTDGTGPPR